MTEKEAPMTEEEVKKVIDDLGDDIKSMKGFTDRELAIAIMASRAATKLMMVNDQERKEKAETLVNVSSWCHGFFIGAILATIFAMVVFRMT